jgi:hypothetical protein
VRSARTLEQLQEKRQSQAIEKIGIGGRKDADSSEIAEKSTRISGGEFRR